jgi:hypothetical protein
MLQTSYNIGDTMLVEKEPNNIDCILSSTC